MEASQPTTQPQPGQTTQAPTQTPAAVLAPASTAVPTASAAPTPNQPSSELDVLNQKLQAAQLPAELKAKCERMLARLKTISQVGVAGSLHELEVTSKYLDWVTALPFGKFSQDNLDLNNAKQVLDKEHYGLTAVKENILEFIATQALQRQQANAQAQATANTQPQQPALSQANQSGTSSTPPAQSSQPAVNSLGPGAPAKIAHPLNFRVTTPVLCFVGVQGIGKTTMAMSIAKSLGRSFVRIPLGAFASVHELRGRNKAEPGAEPGQLVKAIAKAGSFNPVILLDEIDKASSDSGLRADIMAALLEILDPNQNQQFTDRYLDYPLDLSQILFITTANNLTGISAALLDRLEVIRFSSYSDEEKQVIARDYLLPKIRQQTGITPEQLEIAPETWPLVIRPLGFDPGIRQLERNLTSLARQVAKQIVEGYQGKIVVTPENFREFFPETINVMS